jgi:low affinity Fe/Cu permease
MAEFEFAGMTFKGGKAAIVLTALSTLGGALWAGFEFYKDYMDMRDVIANIDTGAIQSDIDERLREMSNLTRETEKDVRDTMRDVENRIETDMEKLENDLEEKLQKALDNPLAD